MGIVFEVLGWLFWDLIFAFIFYTTGALILRVISFGSLRKPIFSFGVFNKEKKQGNKELSTAYITGLIFYVLVISVIIWLN